jgi:hypothetical protein
MTTEPETARRRPLLAIPGWLLVGCLFLPTLRVCGTPTMPIEFPPTYAIYLGGILIGVIGGARLVRSRRRALTVMMSLWTLSLFAIITVWTGSVSPVAGLVFFSLLLFVQIKLTISMFRTDWSETAIAVGCLIHGIIATGWSALLASDPDGMWGAHVALWTGLAIVIVSIVMLAQAREEVALQRRDTEPAPLPTARAIVRD